MERGQWCFSRRRNYLQRLAQFLWAGGPGVHNYGPTYVDAGCEPMAITPAQRRAVFTQAPAQGVVSVPARRGEVVVGRPGGYYLRRRVHRTSNSFMRAMSSMA